MNWKLFFLFLASRTSRGRFFVTPSCQNAATCILQGSESSEPGISSRARSVLPFFCLAGSRVLLSAMPPVDLGRFEIGQIWALHKEGSSHRQIAERATQAHDLCASFSRKRRMVCLTRVATLRPQAIFVGGFSGSVARLVRLVSLQYTSRCVLVGRCGEKPPPARSTC